MRVKIGNPRLREIFQKVEQAEETEFPVDGDNHSIRVSVADIVSGLNHRDIEVRMGTFRLDPEHATPRLSWFLTTNRAIRSQRELMELNRNSGLPHRLKFLPDTQEVLISLDHFPAATPPCGMICREGNMLLVAGRTGRLGGAA